MPTLVRGSAWSLLGRGTASVSTVLLTVILAHVFSAQSLGIYLDLFAISTIASQFFPIGFNTLALRDISLAISNGDIRRASTLSYQFVLIALLPNAVLSMAAVPLFAIFGAKLIQGGGLPAGAVWLVASWLFGQTLKVVLADCLRAWGDFAVYAFLGNAINGALTTVLVLAAWLINGALTLEEVLIFSTLATATANAVAGYSLYKRIPYAPQTLSGGLTLLKELWTGVRMLIGRMLPQVNGDVALLLLTALTSPARASDFGIAFRVAELSASLAIAMDSVVMPMIVSLHNDESREGLERVARLSASIVLVLMIFYAAIIAVLGRHTFTVIFGPSHGAVYVLTLILILGRIATACAGLAPAFLLMLGQERSSSNTAIFSFAILLLLGAALAHFWGGVGVAVALSAALFLRHIFIVWLVYVRTNYVTWPYLSGRSLFRAIRNEMRLNPASKTNEGRGEPFSQTANMSTSGHQQKEDGRSEVPREIPLFNLEGSIKRSRRALRSWVLNFPSLYLLFRRHFTTADGLVDQTTELVIEGFPRSGNSFAEAAVRFSQQRMIKLAHHSHSSAQVRRAVRWNIPCLVLIRDPVDCVVSLIMHEPELFDATRALSEYVAFYRAIQPLRNKILVARFSTVTAEFGKVLDALNLKFGTRLASLQQTPEIRLAIFDLVDKISGERSGIAGFVEPYSPRVDDEAKKIRALERTTVLNDVLADMNRGLLRQAREIFHSLSDAADI